MGSTEDENKALKVLLTVVLSPFATIFSGYVFSRLWQWFAVGPFALRPLRIVECIGIAIIARFLTYDITLTRKDLTTVETVSFMFMGTLILWGYGAIVHLFL